MRLLELIENARPVPVAPGGAIGGYVILYGYSLQESTGLAGAQVNLFDGADTTGLRAIPIPLGPGMAAEDWFGPQGVHFRSGVFAQIATGAVVGSIFISDRPEGPA